MSETLFNCGHRGARIRRVCSSEAPDTRAILCDDCELAISGNRNDPRLVRELCHGIVRGSPASRRGAGRSDDCRATPKFHVVENYSGHAYESDVCGIHARKHFSSVRRNERVAAVLSDPTIATRVKISPLAGLHLVNEIPYVRALCEIPLSSMSDDDWTDSLAEVIPDNPSGVCPTCLERGRAILAEPDSWSNEAINEAGMLHGADAANDLRELLG